jgi:hypothetical protein
MLAHHPIANEAIADHFHVAADNTALFRFRTLDHPSVRFIDSGLYNAHVGSISFLIKTLKRSDPLEFLCSLDFTLPRPLPEYAAALAPFLDRLESTWASIRRP